MKYFQLLAQGLNVNPLMHQLYLHLDLWDEHTIRTTYEQSPHKEVSDILVWFNPLDSTDIPNETDVIPFRAWKELPAIRPLVLGLMAEVGAHRLGRVMITRLGVGGKITPHRDQGAPAQYYSRYQLALQCLPGNVFMINDEQVSFKTGEMWAINNREIHSVVNNSTDDRIVCIIDLRID